MTINNIFSKRFVLSRLLAFSFLKHFPNLQLLNGSATDIGFFYDFVGDFELNEHTFSTIEKTMKEIWEECSSVKIHHMMRENAADFINSLDQPLVAELVEQDPRNVVDLIQIGDYQTYAQTAVEEIDSLPFFKIFSVKNVGDSDQTITRVEGAAFDEQKALKQFLKLQVKAPRWDHVKMGEEQNLFISVDQKWLWLSNGVALRRVVSELLEGFLSDFDYHLIAFSGDIKPFKKTEILNRQLQKNDHPGCFFEWEQVEIGDQDSSRGLFSESSGIRDLQTWITSQSQLPEVISSTLQLIEKVLSFFSIHHRWMLVLSPSLSTKKKDSRAKTNKELLVASLDDLEIDYEVEERDDCTEGARIEVRFIDGFGRMQNGSWITLSTLKNSTTPVVQSSVMGTVDRLVAALIESHKGELPFMLAPVQMAIIPVGKKLKDYADAHAKMARDCGLRVMVASAEDKVGKQIFLSGKENVPYIVMVGDKEQRTSMVSVRTKGNEKRPISILMEELLDDIKRKLLN